MSWISFEEQTPEYGQEILVLGEHRKIRDIFFVSPIPGATHWRPRPADPPKKTRGEELAERSTVLMFCNEPRDMALCVHSPDGQESCDFSWHDPATAQAKKKSLIRVLGKIIDHAIAEASKGGGK